MYSVPGRHTFTLAAASVPGSAVLFALFFLPASANHSTVQPVERHSEASPASANFTF